MAVYGERVETPQNKPLAPDRLEEIGETEKSLAAGEAERWAALPAK